MAQESSQARCSKKDLRKARIEECANEVEYISEVEVTANKCFSDSEAWEQIPSDGGVHGKCVPKI